MNAAVDGFPDASRNVSCLDIPGTVWIDTRRIGRPDTRVLLFEAPHRIYSAWQADEVSPTLNQIESALKEGYFAAGYIGYEAGLILSGILAPRHALSYPLLWMGVYRAPRILSREAPERRQDSPQPHAPSELVFETGEQEFLDAVAVVREHIASGDVYQVNLAGKLSFDNPDGAAFLFRRLRLSHPVPHSAFINTGDVQVVSLSPELFLRRTSDRIVTRPMKGTARRGRWHAEDRMLARRLAADEKSRAENLMIVDLMRNDLGRICRFGSVQARRLFTVERYRSVFQMTSTVEGRLRPETPLTAVLRAALPAGSVTGAPKIRACEIIDRLEQVARGVYCGSVGWFEPSGDFTLNVAIRTAVQRGARCELGVGSGIVADSDARAELSETRLKGAFIGATPSDFLLLETLLWRKRNGYAFFEEHLRRIRLSTRHFGWRFPEKSILNALKHAACQAQSDPRLHSARVRLLIHQNGHCESQVDVLRYPFVSAADARLWLSPHRTDPSDAFLFHKTTRRDLYDVDHRVALELGCIDALFANTRDQITECAITSVLVEIDGVWCAPPLSSGLLPGIWRASQLRRGNVRVRPIRIEDLSRAQRIRIGNSVRGAVEIERVISETGRILFRSERRRGIDRRRQART